jgi:hypothetical protein
MASQVAPCNDDRKANHEQRRSEHVNIDDDRNHAGYDQPGASELANSAAGRLSKPLARQSARAARSAVQASCRVVRDLTTALSTVGESHGIR